MAGPEAPRDPWSAALRRAAQRAASGQIPEMSPRMRFEVRRKFLHVVAAILAVPVLLSLPFAFALALGLASIAAISATWFIERQRLHHKVAPAYVEMVHEPLAQVLEKTRREGEDFPWSPVLYTASLLLIGMAHDLLGLSWAIAFAAYAILGIGDATSALVGIAYGRHRLPWNRRKSVEGTAAGLVAGFLGGAVLSAVPFAFAGLPVPPLFFLVVAAGAVAGSLAETVPRTEDNFVVPLTAATVMFGLSGALGLPLP